MKFQSPTDEPVHISLTSGHTALVTPEGVDLSPLFHKEAVARGCIPSGMVGAVVKSEPVFDRAAVIRQAMTAMLDGNSADDFTTNGKPDLRKLNARVGFQVAREEADKLFADLTEAK